MHAADNAFHHWKAYNEMIGVGGWRGRNEASGPYAWMHQGDELYSKPRSSVKMTVLATAYCDPANHGSGFDEAQLMVSRFAKRCIFHTTFRNDVLAVSSVESVLTFQRGAEWRRQAR